MDKPQQKSLYRAMLAARYVDQAEQEITARGEAFFYVAGRGHEAAAALAAHLIPDDYLHVHYRDKALVLARGWRPKGYFDAVYCNDESNSRGRQMCAHISDKDLNILSMSGPVGSAPLHAAGIAAAVKHLPENPIVLCSVGEGTTQEGEFHEGLAQAVRDELPLLFMIEDNRLAISTSTVGRTFYDTPTGPIDQIFGLKIHRVDGRDVVAVDRLFEEIVPQMRRDRKPALVVLDMERLSDHTNADDQRLYRSEEDIAQGKEGGDPIRRFEQHLLGDGWTQNELDQINDEVREFVAAEEEESASAGEPATITTALRPLPIELTHPSREVRSEPESGGLTMKDAMQAVLRNHLAENESVFLYGQDIEDPKGDVFGLTKGLSTEYPKRVENSPLSESTIIGTAIGRALVGQRPVAFIQFADFLPMAYNQLATDLGSMYWRSDGAWQCPVIVMVPCGSYRPGLGPFHSYSLESTMAHIPGVDVFMPSTAADAAGMLNAAFQSERPSIFMYPKARLNDPSKTTGEDVSEQFVPIGPARKVRGGRDITFVSWGNCVGLCEKAAEELDKIGIEAEILDLRTISPWDQHAVVASAEKTARLIVVHEDNHTCGLGGEVIATVAELARVPVAVRRVASPDTYVPCNFANQLEIVPSFKRILSTAAELLDLDLDWKDLPQAEAGVGFIEAIGSGPSDETVQIVELHMEAGQSVERGETVAALEATKSVFDLSSPLTGVIDEVLVAEGDTIDVGAPIFRVKIELGSGRTKPITAEPCGIPQLRRRAHAKRLKVPRHTDRPRRFDVGLSTVATVKGSRQITNHELLKGHGTMTSDDVIRRTGIESRFWAADGETPVTMAVDACWKALDAERLTPDDVDLIICSTTSPSVVTPSMACQVLNGLMQGSVGTQLQAFDINAACSGYLYALQSGYDFLQSRPDGRVLVVTAEVLSPLLDRDDLDTAILFGDAASATVLYGEDLFAGTRARLLRPELSAKGEDGTVLSVPLLHDGFIQMKGRKVFSEAVRSMVSSLSRVCQSENIDVTDLRRVVPHQANQRIIDAIAGRIGVDVYSNIRLHGNTSSTSIPLCLAELLPSASSGDRLGLCAFGGGFTFGAGILQIN